MPRYFFHLRTSAGAAPDHDGLNFPDLHTAQTDARSSLLSLAVDQRDDDHSIHGIVIADNAGKVLSEIHLDLKVLSAAE